ncbi:MAG: type IV toxin-antitoxin system AbiEi family antitoxin [bacterium]
MKTNVDTKCRRTGAAAAFVENTLETGRITFDLSELVSKTGLSDVAAKNQLQRLRGHIVRVSRHQAFFLIVESQHRPMGAPPVEWWLDAYFRWLGHPYYLALQSAAEIYNSAPQAILVKQVMTDSPRRDISVGRLRIRFFVKRGVERTPTQQPPNAYAPLRVSTPEATALDMVRYASRIGGMGRVLETLAPLLPLFRASELRGALDAEGEVAVAQRLGYLIETTGQNRLAEIVHQWLPSEIVRVPLESQNQVPSANVQSRRWRILVPEKGAAL